MIKEQEEKEENKPNHNMKTTHNKTSPKVSLFYNSVLVLSKGPFTLAIFTAILGAIFAVISSAISNRPCKLLAICKNPCGIASSLPKIALEIAAKIAAKIPSVNGPIVQFRIKNSPLIFSVAGYV